MQIKQVTRYVADPGGSSMFFDREFETELEAQEYLWLCEIATVIYDEGSVEPDDCLDIAKAILSKYNVVKKET